MSRQAVAVLKGTEANGVITFSQAAEDAVVTVSGDIKGLTAGQHGFHIHQHGDTSNGCVSTGGHFNPFGKQHGGPTDENRHAGDLGNVTATEEGCAVAIEDKVITLFGPNSIVGRAVVVHAGTDDLGKGGFDDSLTTGHAGGRVCCGVIGLAASK
mmetsp:Transcript_131720/g.185834  ORF Transcript_131720/g.185834 Transcript_131720/m.185834 type:complete len:155 (+) Transcript_131720:20-484(+)